MLSIIIWCLIGVGVNILTAYFEPKYYFATLFLHPVGWIVLAIMGYYAYNYYLN